MLRVADVEGFPDLSWVGAAFVAAIWFIGAFAILYRMAVAFDGRASLSRLAVSAAILAAWTGGSAWLAFVSLPD